MVSNEKYRKFLRTINSCISHGDYYVVKELSHLELEKMKDNKKQIEKDVKKIKKKRNSYFDKYGREQLNEILNQYSEYIEKKLEKAEDLEKLKEEMITIEEFVKKKEKSR